MHCGSYILFKGRSIRNVSQRWYSRAPVESAIFFVHLKGSFVVEIQRQFAVASADLYLSRDRNVSCFSCGNKNAEIKSCPRSLPGLIYFHTNLSHAVTIENRSPICIHAFFAQYCGQVCRFWLTMSTFVVALGIYTDNTLYMAQ